MVLPGLATYWPEGLQDAARHGRRPASCATGEEFHESHSCWSLDGSNDLPGQRARDQPDPGARAAPSELSCFGVRFSFRAGRGAD